MTTTPPTHCTSTDNPERINSFISQLAIEPPLKCAFKVGQKVTFVNEYGVSFPGHTITGFAKSNSFYGRFIHLDTDAYWMPAHPSNVIPE